MVPGVCRTPTEFGGSKILYIMLFSHTVMAVITSALLLVSGTQALTPPDQAPKQEVAVNPVYPRDPEGKLIPWRDLLSRDQELYELASTCEAPGLDPETTNYKDAKITGYPSYSILQYQPGTFLAGVKAYNAYPGVSDKIAVPMPEKYLEKYADAYNLSIRDRNILAAIYDPYLDIYVARHMINDGEGHQWSCYNSLNLVQKYPVWKTKSELSSKNLN